MYVMPGESKPMIRKSCDYKLSGFRSCPHGASHVHTTVRSTPDGGRILKHSYRCADHAQATDMPIHEHVQQLAGGQEVFFDVDNAQFGPSGVVKEGS